MSSGPCEQTTVSAESGPGPCTSSSGVVTNYVTSPKGRTILKVAGVT